MKSPSSGARGVLGLAGVTAITLALTVRADAGLGEGPGSIGTDQARMKGQLRSAAMQGYDRHEIQTAAGSVVREMADGAGTVFGVAWDGPFQPDLRALLAGHFDGYAQAMRQRPRGRGSVVLRLPDLVVEMWGHPRSFHGRAYLPQQLPAGVSADVVR